ncbi:MAG TPA: shikimate dehydrogenase [Acidimicrobiales bacterium]|nr:shikimate dehydrogenase [Acidimicrobiales bacterium]
MRAGIPLSAATEVAGVIGSPIRHSLSPALFNAAFAELGLDWAFLAFEVAPGAAGGAIAGFRGLGLRGLSVTMPHKTEMAGLVDRLTPAAQRLEAVNSVYWSGSDTVGDNTDGAGFLDSLGAEGVEPAGLSCVVLGAGGAARAVVLALAGAGASEVLVVNRSPEAASRAAALAGGLGRTGPPGEVAGAALIVNATPLGMGGDPRMALEPGLLRPGQVVVDLVYHPLTTPLLTAAAERGARPIGGLGMLVRQAGHQLRAWTGLDPPLEAMRAGVAARLEGSRFSV